MPICYVAMFFLYDIDDYNYAISLAKKFYNVIFLPLKTAVPLPQRQRCPFPAFSPGYPLHDAETPFNRRFQGYLRL